MDEAAPAGRPFVGRVGELATLDEEIARVAAREPAIAVVTGEPGIGKTRLLAVAAERARGRGIRALSGSATELEREQPYAVFVDALDARLAELGPDGPRGLNAEQRGLLAEVFPALAGLRGTSDGDLELERYRAHHAVRVLLGRLSEPAPLALMLDDVQWADRASLELIAHLVRRPAESRVLLVLAWRSGWAGEGIARPLDDAERAGRCRRLCLEPLSLAEAEPLLDRELAEDRRQAIFRASGGNPFYLEQLARLPATGGDRAFRAATDPAGEVPEGIVRALSAELADLDEGVRLVGAAAAVAGEPFDAELVAAIAEREPEATLAALDALAARDLVRRSERPGALRFRHPIVRHGLYRVAPPAWIIGAHARAAAALRDAGAPAGLRAHHEERAAAPGDEEAIAVLVAAAEESRALAPATAARWLHAALRLLPPGSGTEANRLELLPPLALAEAAAGRLERATDALKEALALLPPDAGLARARVVSALAFIEHLGGPSGDARATLQATLAELPEDARHEASALHHELAIDHFYAGEAAAGVRSATTAAELAGEAGAPVLLAAARGLRAVLRHGIGELDGARADASAAAALLDEADDVDVAAQPDSFFCIAMAELDLERLGDAERHVERGFVISRISRQSHLLVPLRMLAAFVDVERGELAAAREHASAAEEMARLVDAPQLTVFAGCAGCLAALRGGDLAGAVAAGEEAQRALAEVPNAPRDSLGLTWLATARIEAGDAVAGREAMLAAAGGVELQRLELGHRPAACEALARAELALGDPEAAARWADLAMASAAPLGLGGKQAIALRAQAVVALATGSPARAADLALEAAELSASIGAALEVARSRMLAGRALFAAGERERAVAELQRARDALEARGARRDSDLAAAALREAGVAIGPRGRRGSGSGLDALSERELEVASLVHDRLTNREIAERLVISEKTVERHMTRIFGRLGIRSRVDLARAYERERQPRRTLSGA